MILTLRSIGLGLYGWATWRVMTATGVQVRLCVLAAIIGVLAVVAGELLQRPVRTWED